MIRLNVFIKTSAENREKVLEITKKLVEGSVRDAVCIAYDVFVSGTNPESLFICETWENEESLAAHGKAPHYVELVPALKELAELKVERFDF